MKELVDEHKSRIKTSGKTGTVKKIGNLGYEEQSLNALFVGQASLNQKNLIVGIIIRDSQLMEVEVEMLLHLRL